MPSKDKWLLMAGLFFLFSYGIQFISGLLGRPVNILGSLLGAEVLGFVMFFFVWIIIWASGAIDWTRRKVKI